MKSTSRQELNLPRIILFVIISLVTLILGATILFAVIYRTSGQGFVDNSLSTQVFPESPENLASPRRKLFAVARQVPGDVAIYNGGIFDGHTNLVLAIDGDEITTLGGNENNRINLMRFNYKDQKYSLLGFGLPPGN